MERSAASWCVSRAQAVLHPVLRRVHPLALPVLLQAVHPALRQAALHRVLLPVRHPAQVAVVRRLEREVWMGLFW